MGMGASVRGVTPALRVQENPERRVPGQSLQDPRVSPGQGAPRPWCPLLAQPKSSRESGLC